MRFIKIPGLSFARRVRHFNLVMDVREALKVALAERRSGEFHISLRAVGRSIVLRGGTTDIRCFEKVFLANEYHSPFLGAPKTIIDGGANIGMATLYFASKYPAAHIIAIEPEANNARLLRRNCAGLPNVTIIEGALWPTKRTVALSDPGIGAYGFSVMDERKIKKVGEVETVTIQELCDRLGGHIDLLKLDIEGSERELFSEGVSWLDQVGEIVIELHDHYRTGCAKAFYSAVAPRWFRQEIIGENIFVDLSR